MRKLHAFLAAALLLLSSGPRMAQADVFISELCDPQANYFTDRFIEIYNSGPAAVDLTGWTLVAIANGVNVHTWTLSGTIGAGTAKVAGNPAPVTAFAVDFPSALWVTNGSTGAAFNWNGKIGDGAKLKNGTGITVDSLQATADLFVDKDMVRISSVGTGSLGLNVAEWTITAVTLASSASPGSHNGSAPPVSGPTISGVVTIPAPPVAGAPTDVQATVTDPNSLPINAVTLSWGTTAGSLTNLIGMVNTTGNTYLTSAQIPGQIVGATIFYRVSAEDDSASSQSAIQSYTIGGGGGGVPPTITSVGEMSDSTLLVFFSEPVAQASAELPSNYTIGANVAVNAIRDLVNTNQVWVTFRGLTAGTNTLTVNGVADLNGDITIGATKSFNYVDVTIPANYYSGTAGLKGSALQIRLHNIIKAHTVVSYSSLLTWFQITDIKPNGKVWDIYSDIPGGIPPYEFTFGQTGNVSSNEGVTYNREHSTPQSWFAEVSPPVSDAFHIYPTDGKVNGIRSNYAYGEVGTPTITTMNGSMLGPSVTPGYSGTVFEPIDAFKGDCIRSSFYMATRYLFEDGSWPGGAPTSHAQLLPWAAAQYLQWSQADPVSWKERMRNGAIYTFQHNRNPFIDHPEFLVAIYDSNSVAGVEPTHNGRAAFLRPNTPNPFSSRTTIGFDLPRRDQVALHIYDVTGRQVRTLVAKRSLEAGSHQMTWDGSNDVGGRVEAGLYFCRIDVGAQSETRRVVFAK
ncbi:MAG: endonuclease [Candidatus Eisenbacteria bacterium]|nr:endonuclease [Candidatus Eisenbacteria bacterium]